jgi:hypothetical protein
VLTYATHWLTDQQKADLICKFLKKNGPSTCQTICEGTVPQMNYGQFVRGVSYISHTMQTVWGTPFICDPTTYKYSFPQMWDDNIHGTAKNLKYAMTLLHKVGSNLRASLQQAQPDAAGNPGIWAADEPEIENLLISVTRMNEDVGRSLKNIAKRHAGIRQGMAL